MALSGASSSKQLKFGGEFEFDFSAYQLRQSGSVLKLERIPTELLLMLIERRGQLVTRDQIVERVWGKDVFLDTDNSINAAIRKIRQVLKDDPEQPRFVQTLTGRGYRFIAQVEESGPQANAGSGPDQPTSPSDNLLGKKVSHYRILQLLGGGGMGVVYMAEDLKLGRRVALKFLPAEVGSDPKVFERFEREARAASSLDHPNICSIYQLGEHEGRPFIVMQMLEGRTLREWIECASQRDRQSNLGEMLDLARQITDGLEAAHKKGIVHRDIKPANIFVTTSGRAKILDFGVAKITETFEVCEPKAGGNAVPGDAAGTVADPSLTRTEGSLGTPSYVSPEQIRREKVDARSDLYSFGLVLYEMATGKRAFAGNTVTAIRDAVLRSPVTPPRQVSPAIPVDLERIIQKSLEKDPDQRYQSASDLRTDLLGVSTGVRSRPSVKTVGLGIAAGAVLVAAILFAMNTGGVRSRLFRPPETSGTGQVRTRPSVAVIGFKNLSGKQEEGWISTALAEMLSTELAAGQQLRVIPGENVTRMKLDLVLPPSDSYAGDTLARIRNHLNSDLIVVGSYLALGKDSGGKVRLDLQLQDARAGETITSVTTDGTESDLTDLVSRSGATLRQKLGVADITTQDQSRVSSSFPTNPDAARFYAEGLSKLQTFDAFGARELLQKAVGIDPNHALTHSALAQCWSLLGYDAKSREEAKIAVDLSANLLREDQLSIEARYYETSHEWQKAIEIYRMLWGVFPDSLEYGLRLARAQASAGAGKDAIGTVEKLSKLPPPAGADPRIDLAESLAADQIGDLRREEAAAARAAEKGRRLEARIIIASALLARGSALIALGDNTNAATVLREAQAFFSSVGDQQSVARTLIDLAIIARHQSNLDEAQKLLESALEISRRTGNALSILKAESNLGNVFFEKGDLDRCIAVEQETLKLSREIGAKKSEATSLNNLAGSLAMQGRLKESFQMFEQALRLARDLGDEEGVAIALGNMADVLTRQGQLQAARKAGEEALVIHRKVGDKSYEAYALHQLGLIRALQGDLAGARTWYQQTVAVRHELGEKTTEAETQLLQAQLRLDSGDAAGAESAARRTAAIFHEEGATDDEVLSYAVLSQALAAQKNLSGALQAIAKSKELVAKSLDQATHLEVEIDEPYVSALSQASSTGSDTKKLSEVAALQAAWEKADRMGYVGFALQAQLRLGEVELASGMAKAGRTHLEQLQKDAQGRGFLLIASHAKALLGAQSAHR